MSGTSRHRCEVCDEFLPRYHAKDLEEYAKLAGVSPEYICLDCETPTYHEEPLPFSVTEEEPKEDDSDDDDDDAESGEAA